MDGIADKSSSVGKRYSFLADSLGRLWKEKRLGAAGGLITLLLLLVGIFADVLAPYGLNETNMENILAPPSGEFWLGTDNLGRDVLSRVIFGTRVSVIIGLAGATLATVVSVLIGVVSGYIGGKFDMLVQRIVDARMCLPSLVLIMVLISLIGPGMFQVSITIGIAWGISGSRIVRSAVLGIKENTYISAAIAVGCPTARILVRHVLPNIMAPIIVLFTTRVPSVILTEASLSFLGFGVPPPAPSWGSMIGDGREYMFMAPWMIMWPGLALSIVVYGVNMFGDAARDLLDPRMRGSGGRYEVRAKEARRKMELTS